MNAAAKKYLRPQDLSLVVVGNVGKFDEPLASLDTERKVEIMPATERLRDEGHIPILYVSHAFDEVARLADTLVLMTEAALPRPAASMMSSRASTSRR